jgi:hypothetical protein
VANALATLPAISRALAEIATVPEAKDLRDKAAALCRYAKESRQSLEIQNRAAYVKLLCERKAGALLLEIPRANGGPGGRGSSRKANASMAAALRQAGIPESTARRWQYLAQWPEAELMALLGACNEDEEELTTSIAVSSARAFLESLKHADEEPDEADEPDDGQQESEDDAPTESAWKDEREESPAPTYQEKQSPIRVEAERARRLLQLLDAACDLCRDSPPLVGWITTMNKWQSKLNEMIREN